MSDLRERYPARSFLLQKERKFLVRRSDGSLDPIALRTAHKLLAFAPIEADTRARLQKSITRVLCVGDTVNKGAWSYGDLEAAGKLHTSFGFPIVIEVPDGGTRSGTSKDGTKWETKLDGMSYGFLPDTIAADAEELDVIVGKDIAAPMAFVIDQGDECKLALGYTTAQDARSVYEKNWPAGMLKELYEVPMEVVRALLNTSPASLTKAIHAAKRMSRISAGTVVMSNGELIGEIRKSSISAPRPAAMLQEPLEVALKAHAERMLKMLDGARSYQGDVTSIDEHPELAGHPARTAPLSWRYNDPEAVGGWLGAIEPRDESWIAFVDTTGRVLLWTKREADGGIIGAPVSLMRSDLVASPQAKGAMDAGTFADGGAKLPGQTQLRDNEHYKGKYDDIDFSIPSGVAEEAQRGLDWRAEHGRGGTDVGVATARTLVGERNVSPQKARHIAEYFPRHEVDKKGEGYSPGEPGFPSNGRIAWALWGGDPGRAWADKLVEQMNLRDDRANKSRFQKDIQFVPVAKTVDESKPMTVFSVVLEPEPNDGAGDLHRETYSEEFVRQTAHDYTAWHLNLDDQHGEFLPATRAVVVESYCTKQAEPWGDRVVKKGTWIMGIRIYCPELKRQILAGEKTGLSIEGFAERIPNTPQNAASIAPAA